MKKKIRCIICGNKAQYLAKKSYEPLCEECMKVDFEIGSVKEKKWH